MISQSHRLEGHITYFSGKILLIIGKENPVHIQQRIGCPEIQMLVAVYFITLLRFAHTQEGARVNVVIYFCHIGKSMVYHIVFGFSHKYICAEKIERQARHIVDPLVFTKAAVRAVVHYIEADCRRQAA